MARGNLKTRKHNLTAESKFDSIILAKFINHVMLNGKKSVAEKIVYDALKNAGAKLKISEMEVFEQALKNVGPILEVKSKRIGGANYQVPIEVSKERRNTLAMRWILNAARDGSGKPMAEKLSNEFMNAYNGEGTAIKKKQDTHRMAEANKAYAHFARF